MSNNKNSVVYKVIQCQNDEEEDIFFYAKCVNFKIQPFLYNTLLYQAAINRRIPYNHPNLLGIRKPFVHKNIYSVLIPYMKFGSLRTIMQRKFKYGLPEDFILIVLRETLIGLSVIHENNQVHREINAGHIFFDGEENQIKMAFSCSVFDLDCDQEPGHSSMNSICEWTAAPEILNDSNETYLNYTKKTDVWMIGVTVLELLYGGIRVKNRNDFDYILDWIFEKDRLPKKREGKYLQVQMGGKDSIEDDSEVFAEELGRLVIRCLAKKPERRPSVDDLLGEGVFTTLTKDLVQFHNEISEDAEYPLPEIQHDNVISNEEESFILQFRVGSQGEVGVFTAVDLYNSARRVYVVATTNEVLSTLVHPNILTYYHTQLSGTNFCVIPFMELGSIRGHLKLRYKNGLPEGYVLFIVKHIVRGLFCIHTSFSTHSEINAGHIMLNKHGEIKLAYRTSVFDLDSDNIQNNRFWPMDQVCIWGSAPEVFYDHNDPSWRTDIWQVGMTALELCYGKFKVEDRHQLDSFIQSNVGNQTQLIRGSRKLYNLISMCLATDPGLRPTALQLLQSPFIQAVNDEVWTLFPFQ